MRGQHKNVVEPPPVIATIKYITVERVEIYCHVPPTGKTIPMEGTPIPVEDYVTDEDEVSEAVRKLRPKLSGGPSGMQVENPRKWIGEATYEVRTDVTHCRNMVVLVQAAFRDETLAEEGA